MKVRTFKPMTEPVEDELGNHYVLKTPDEDAYCEWNDARIRQAKFDDSTGKVIVQHDKLYKSTRALLVGLCLYRLDENGGQLPGSVGEQFVRDTFDPPSISKMYNWLMEAGGFMADGLDDAKKS